MKRIDSARLIAVSAAAATFVWACPAGALADDYDLRPRFTPGQELYYKHTTQIQTVQTRAEEDQTSAVERTSKTELGYRFRAIELRPDKSAVVEWTLAYFAMESDSPTMMKYDSRSAEFTNPMLAGAFSEVIDKPATLTITPEGQVSEVKGFDETVLASPAGPMIKNTFSEQAIQQLPIFMTANAAYPAAVGSSWTRHDEYEMSRGMGTMVADWEFRLDKVNDAEKLAEIECQATMKLKEVPADQEAEQTPPPIKINKGKLTGRLFWDLAKGELARTESTVEMVMERQTPRGGVTVNQAATQQFVRTTRAELGLEAPKPKDTPPQKAADDSSIQ